MRVLNLLTWFHLFFSVFLIFHPSAQCRKFLCMHERYVINSTLSKCLTQSKCGVLLIVRIKVCTFYHFSLNRLDINWGIYLTAAVYENMTVAFNASFIWLIGQKVNVICTNVLCNKSTFTSSYSMNPFLTGKFAHAWLFPHFLCHGLYSLQDCFSRNLTKIRQTAQRGQTTPHVCLKMAFCTQLWTTMGICWAKRMSG